MLQVHVSDEHIILLFKKLHKWVSKQSLIYDCMLVEWKVKGCSVSGHLSVLVIKELTQLELPEQLEMFKA